MRLLPAGRLDEVPAEGPRRVAYTVDAFDREVQNGGLCQYFVNSSRETAPELGGGPVPDRGGVLPEAVPRLL